MGLATIDPHSPACGKCRPSFTKSSKIDPIVSKIQPFENVKFYNEMYGHPDAVRHISLFDVFKSLYLSKN